MTQIQNFFKSLILFSKCYFSNRKYRKIPKYVAAEWHINIAVNFSIEMEEIKLLPKVYKNKKIMISMVRIFLSRDIQSKKIEQDYLRL